MSEFRFRIREKVRKREGEKEREIGRSHLNQGKMREVQRIREKKREGK